jgi:hypothetical protein
MVISRAGLYRRSCSPRAPAPGRRTENKTAPPAAVADRELMLIKRWPFTKSRQCCANQRPHAAARAGRTCMAPRHARVREHHIRLASRPSVSSSVTTIRSAGTRRTVIISARALRLDHRQLTNAKFQHYRPSAISSPTCTAVAAKIPRPFTTVPARCRDLRPSSSGHPR